MRPEATKKCPFTGARPTHWSPQGKLGDAHKLVSLVLIGCHLLALVGQLTATTQLCRKDDYTNDLPIFIEKRSICNYDEVEVLVYTIKTNPAKPADLSHSLEFCLKGDHAEMFNITKENELKLLRRLELTEAHFVLQIIRTADNIVETPSERRRAINAIEFILVVEDCNQVSWQTIVVAVLSSVCVILMSTLAIMLILYQQKGLIRHTDDDNDNADESHYRAPDLRDESFINPRRTSSYEFNTIKHSEMAPDIHLETETETENL